MTPTCIAHACYLRWLADNCESVPILDVATALPNSGGRYSFDLQFTDGSTLTLAPTSSGLTLYWGEPQ